MFSRIMGIILALVVLGSVPACAENASVSERDVDLYMKLRAHCVEQGLEPVEEAYVLYHAESYAVCAWDVVGDVVFSVVYEHTGELAFYELKTKSSSPEFSMTVVGLIQCLEQYESMTDAAGLLSTMLNDLNGQPGIATRHGEQAMYALSMLPVTGNSLRIFRNT